MKMNSKEIPSVLQDLFFSILVLWQKSKYYNTKEKISNLFRNVSNAIISRCVATINLDDLFEGNVKDCINELNNSIKTGISWKNIYSESIRYVENIWELD